MASLPFPDTGTRLVILRSGKPAANATPGYLYADEDLTIPAEVYADDDGVKGALIPADDEGRVSIRLNSHGEQVDYWGPADGTDRLWIVVGGFASKVDADYNARIDSLGVRVSAVESGGANDTLVVHKAGAETITGTKTFSVQPVIPTPTAGTSPTTKTYVDSGDAAVTTAAATDATSKVATEATARASADTAAIATAAADATTKANAAQAAAATDATTKVAAEATSRASGDTSAIATAAADATTKANAAQAAAVQRANHTGTQAISTITGLQTSLDAKVDEGALVINVKDAPYGAVGDGVTDDITAIRAAVSAVGTTGGIVFFPPGIYGITNTILGSRPGLVLCAPSSDSVTIKALSAMSTMVFGTGTSARRHRRVEDITFDANGLAVVVDSMTYNDAGSVYRRCKFTGMASSHNFFSLASVHDVTIEDCDLGGTGTTLGTAISISGGSKRLTIRNNKFRYLENFIVVDTGPDNTTPDTEYVFADSDIVGNTFDAGWWLLPAQSVGSGGTVTYTGTTVTDSGAAFPALAAPNKFNVRVLTPLATGTGGTVTYPRIEILDSTATFITAGITRGMIVRVGTAFAVVSNVRSETNLAVEEWLDDSTRARVVVPTSGTAYTVYGVVLGSVQSNTSTALTVTRWHDLTGATVTPSSGTRYELLYQRPNYTIHSELGTRNIRVAGNIVRRPWSDGISLYGPGVTIEGNTVEDGEDMGITSNGTAIIRGNRIRRQGAGGIFSSGADSVIEGNDVQDSTWVNSVDLRSLGDIMVYGGARTVVTGNKCRTGGTRAQARHGIVLYDAATVDCVIGNNESSGHSVADYRVDQTVTGSNDISFVKGSLVTGSGAGPQRLDIAGTGSPEGVVQAAISSRFRRTDGGTASTAYIKETGTGNTGWSALGPASVTRTTTTASTATPTPNASTTDVYELSALAVSAAFAAPAGTPVDGQSLLIRIKDNGGGQALTWDVAYRVIGATLPVVTTAGKQLYVGCKYNATASKWDVLAVAAES